jgi:hypothetical protein
MKVRVRLQRYGAIQDSASASSPAPSQNRLAHSWGEADACPRAAGEGPNSDAAGTACPTNRSQVKQVTLVSAALGWTWCMIGSQAGKETRSTATLL